MDARRQWQAVFQSDEAQIRALDFDNSGNLIAGTDGSGLIYRISPQGEGFVLYSAPKKEITALAVDAQGNIYAAGAGEKRGAHAPSQRRPQRSVDWQPRRAVEPPSRWALRQFGALGACRPGFTAIPYPNADQPRRLRDVSPRARRFAEDDMDVARRSGLCVGFRSGGASAGRDGQSRQDLCHRRQQYIDLAQASANQVTAFAPCAEGRALRSHQQPGKDFSAWSQRW